MTNIKRQSHHRLVFLSFLVLASLCSRSLIAETQKSAVMMLGVFHFSDAGLDQVKGKEVNVMSPENQVYIDAMTNRMSQFKPTVVLLEFDAEYDKRLNDRYQAYLSGEYALPANEIYQLGFRIAKAAGLARIDGFDDRGVGWDAEPLFEYMEKVDLTAKAAMDNMYAQLAKKSEQDQARLNLRGLLMNANDVDEDRHNMSIYLSTNQVGTDANPVGATAAASWWHRNFRMFAKIQRVALAPPSQRVLVIGGQGHTAILKTLLSLDSRLDAVDPVPFL